MFVLQSGLEWDYQWHAALLTFRTGKYFLDLCKHRVGGLAGVHLAVQPPALVVSDQGLGEAVVLLQPLLQHLGVVVIPPHERLARHVVLARHPRRVELLVVGAPAGQGEPPTANSLH